ncbi:NfeD family protein [Caldimonas tepidiphila]|uniref:NfeD family protein n=1 Tax=Caldimonas tepidiphila TaxID=2315841 RepID=UPI000E5B11B4|nr:NfeD family protein [Caldimonas tepidiphila]
MDLGPATGWWVAAGVVVALELLSGSFHLLMLGIGLAAGALAAHAGFGLPMQIVTAAVIGGGAVGAWVVRRQQEPPSPPAGANRDVMLDIGERVHVERWDADGSARVHYRGAEWSARWAGPGAPAPGEHVIEALEGSRLVLRR